MSSGMTTLNKNMGTVLNYVTWIETNNAKLCYVDRTAS